ncbi:MAG: nicotinamidase [Acetobacter sp.]|nr:nicotinamidase [Acetobacter sp.]
MILPGSADALLIVDVQNDFLPGGALPVPDADDVIDVINALSQLPFGAVIAAQDWHPADHCSFRSAHSAGLWPSHCVAGTWGADFPEALRTVSFAAIIRKGMRMEVDSYSAFFDNDGTYTTGLAAFLGQRGIRRVFVAGLALDYCVMATALDAVKAGFETFVIADACRAIVPEDAHEARLRQAGVGIIVSDQFTFMG